VTVRAMGAVRAELEARRPALAGAGLGAAGAAPGAKAARRVKPARAAAAAVMFCGSCHVVPSF